MDKYGIDSQKLHYHVERVAAWKRGELVYPIYAEISPAGACNHRCTFCAVDYIGYKRRHLDAGLLAERLCELGRLGLKSAMYAGEGEPLLHREFARIVEATKAAGVDAALTTNAVFLTPELDDCLMTHLTWLKVSCNAGSASTYSKIHRCKESDFDKVLGNVRRAVQHRDTNRLKCTVGIQMVLLPENRAEAEELARRARDLGTDYLVVKPYSQHPRSLTRTYQGIQYSEDSRLRDELSRLNTDRFQVVVRVNAMRTCVEAEDDYERCVSLPFWTYIDTGGVVWGCSAYMGHERFDFGNIHDQTFEAIWTGEKRAKTMEFVHGELDARTCRTNCRMDKVNRYLHRLLEKPAHANFI